MDLTNKKIMTKTKATTATKTMTNTILVNFETLVTILAMENPNS